MYNSNWHSKKKRRNKLFQESKEKHNFGFWIKSFRETLEAQEKRKKTNKLSVVKSEKEKEKAEKKHAHKKNGNYIVKHINSVNE